MSQPIGSFCRTAILNPHEVLFDPRHPVASDDMDFKKLKQSIKRYGQLADILVREEQGKTIVVTGKRRLLAIQQLDLPGVRCTFVEGDSNLLSFIENSTHQKMTVMKQAMEMQRLKEECHVSDGNFVKSLGKSEAERLQRLIDANLSKYMQKKLIHDERISLESMWNMLTKSKGETEAKISKFISSLNAQVPSPTKREEERLKYVLGRENTLRHFILSAQRSLSIIYDEAIPAEERSKYCRMFIKILSAYLVHCRKIKKDKQFLPDIQYVRKTAKAPKAQKWSTASYQELDAREMTTVEKLLHKSITQFERKLPNE